MNQIKQPLLLNSKQSITINNYYQPKQSTNHCESTTINRGREEITHTLNPEMPHARERLLWLPDKGCGKDQVLLSGVTYPAVLAAQQ